MSKALFITTEDGGRNNIFPTESKIQLIEGYTSHPIEAEKANGRWAMLGFIALIGAYFSTGQIIPGIF